MSGGVIFDMDGLLIDSEPLWWEAEIAGFAAVGLRLDETLCQTTMGLRTDEVVRHWFARHPWSGASLEEVARDIVERVGRLIDERGQALPGAREAVALARAEGHRVALASSSSKSLIRRVLRRLDLVDAFDAVCSAEDEALGKPDPAVFLSAARELGLEPRQCVVLEDSTAGVAAARAAGMRVIAVPLAGHHHRDGFARVDHLLTSLVELTPEMLGGPARPAV